MLFQTTCPNSRPSSLSTQEPCRTRIVRKAANADACPARLQPRGARVARGSALRSIKTRASRGDALPDRGTYRNHREWSQAAQVFTAERLDLSRLSHFTVAAGSAPSHEELRVSPERETRSRSVGGDWAGSRTGGGRRSRQGLCPDQVLARRRERLEPRSDSKFPTRSARNLTRAMPWSSAARHSLAGHVSSPLRGDECTPSRRQPRGARIPAASRRDNRRPARLPPRGARIGFVTSPNTCPARRSPRGERIDKNQYVSP